LPLCDRRLQRRRIWRPGCSCQARSQECGWT